MIAAEKAIHPERLAEFEHWIRERHQIFYRRHVLREKPPWTTDPVLGGTFFTNVYRELDPGTKWFVGHLIRGISAASDSDPWATIRLDAMLNAFVYRMALNEGSMGALGWLSVATFDSPTMRRRLKEYDGPVFTPAYMVRSNAGSKIDSVCDSYLRIADTLDQRRDEILAIDEDRKAFVEWCARNLHGIGPFVAFQVLVDLSYPEVNCHLSSNDGWAGLGPGSQKGLTLLFGGYEWANDRMAWLCDYLNPRLADLPGWVVDTDFIPIHRANMQNCLCEYSKYHRALTGKGARRKFFPADSRVRDREELGHGKQLDLL